MKQDIRIRAEENLLENCEEYNWPIQTKTTIKKNSFNNDIM